MSAAIAEWFHAVADLIDKRIDVQSRRHRYTEQASEAQVHLSKAHAMVVEALNDIREDIHGLPGWSGEEPTSVQLNEIGLLKKERALLVGLLGSAVFKLKGTGSDDLIAEINDALEGK
jgi:hypothetical protein